MNLRSSRLSDVLAAVTLSVGLLFGLQGASAAVPEDDTLHTALALPYLLHLPASGPKGAPLIVLLHGMGSNERDLYSLRQQLPPQYAIVSVRAPYELDPGAYQWFEGTTVSGRLDGNPAQLEASAKDIEQLVGQLERQYGFNAKRVYLVGFSQGAIMSYEVALTDPKAFRGIGVMSGAFFDSLRPSVVRSRALAHLRVFISHGDIDMRIPPDYEQEAVARLQDLGITPEYHLYPGMQHQINDTALEDLVTWLGRD
jgi:phospholipase/carboxylesterase